MVKMEAKAVYEMLGDSEAVRRNKYGMKMALSEDSTEAVLRGIDGYLQAMVREYRERNGKERDVTVERNAAKIILSLMGYETEGGDRMEDLDEVEDAVKYLISVEEVKAAIAERNKDMVTRLHERIREEERIEMEMGE